jgi:hypothetical protein
VPRLEHLVTYHANLKPPVEIGEGPFGNRSIHDVTGGTFEGPRLRGTLVASGGDWILRDSSGVGRLDVRATLETDDGARIYLQYYGVIVLNDAVLEAMAASREVQYGDLYFMTQPRFETGDPRYAWLNAVVAVAEGRPKVGGVEYRVYQVLNDSD